MTKIKNYMLDKMAARAAQNEEEGQGLVEYGLILALIAVVCVAALTALGTGISGMLGGLAGNI